MSDKNKIKHHKQEPRGQPFPAGDHKAAMNRRESMKKKQDINNTNDPQKKYRLRTVSKNILPEGLNRFDGASLILSSDVDQDTQMFGLHDKII